MSISCSVAVVQHCFLYKMYALYQKTEVQKLTESFQYIAICIHICMLTYTVKRRVQYMSVHSPVPIELSYLFLSALLGPSLHIS